MGGGELLPQVVLRFIDKTFFHFFTLNAIGHGFMYRKVIEPLKGIGIHLSFVEQEKLAE